MMSQKNLCAFCKKISSQSCSKCSEVFYCSKEHQTSDWKRHKNVCAPFKMLSDEILGRYLVATRDIRPGEMIMKKNPLILSPKMVSAPLCLGCHKKLNLDERFDCEHCKWPLCSKGCQESTWHKHECQIFKKTGIQPNFIQGDDMKQTIYSGIAPLRALLLKSHDLVKFQALIQCQEHLEEHIKTPMYDILRRTLMPLFLEKLKINTDEKEVLKICSIFDTNAFEVRDTKGTVNIRGLYPTINLLSHDCKHNTKHCFYQSGNNFQLVLTATVAIRKGDKITTTYTQTLWGTLPRRWHLKRWKHFDCVCERCKDPTEFGTYVGAINCSQCKELDQNSDSKLVSLDPLDQNSDWRCENCGYLTAGKSIVWGNDTLRKEIAAIDKKSPIGLERFLEKYKMALHPKNSHFLEVKYALSQMYGNLKGFELENLTAGLLDRKIDLCHELLEVADILEPGYSRFRGSLLYDLQAAMVMKAKVDFAEEKITKAAAEEIFQEAIDYLQEASKILESEPDLNEVLQKRLHNLQQILTI